LRLSNYHIPGFKPAGRSGEPRVHEIEDTLDVKKVRLKHREMVQY
jgi:hypothetical protein